MDVAVLGAGGTGRVVAGRCAVAGHTVHLHGDDANVVMDTVDDIERAHGVDARAAVDGTTDLENAVSDADLVVDATDGDAATKRDLVADVEDLVEDDTLIATSHPSVAVTAVAAGLRRPGRAVGLHFVEPASGPLVEVVVADQTTGESLERARDFVDGLDCTAIVVRDTPGFAVTRLDLALVVEATRMLEDGVASVTDVDDAMAVGRAHPRGPLALADAIGIDRLVPALEDLADRLDGRFDPPGLLREKRAAGATGKVAGEGFYVWENGEPVAPADPDPAVPTRDETDDRPGR